VSVFHKRVLRILLTTGFIAVSIGTAVAHHSPATEYELSIYAATPTIFWILSISALMIAVVVPLVKTGGTNRGLGLALGGITMTAIVALPTIRGYYHINQGDALSHVGRVIDLKTGALTRYPATHISGAVLGDIAAVRTHHALQILVVVFAVAYFVFVPLVVREFTPHQQTLDIGVFSGLLLLPINNISSHINIHPSSFAVLYTPVLLYLFYRLYKSPSWQNVFVFLLVGVMFNFLHLQQAVNFIAFICGIVGIHILHTWVSDRPSDLVGLEVITAIVSFLGLSWWWWVQNQWRFWFAIRKLIAVALGQRPTQKSTSGRAASLDQVGGSVPELFLKLFSVPLVYGILACLVLLASSMLILEIRWGPEQSRSFGLTRSTPALLTYYATYGLVVVSTIFIIYFDLSISDQYFRHFAFIMVIITVFGAIGIGRLLAVIDRPRYSKYILIGLLIPFLLISGPIVHSSPYIYQTSEHVTENQISGFDTAFEYSDETSTYAWATSDPTRYEDSLRGATRRRRTDERPTRRLPRHFAATDLSRNFEGSVYFTITTADIQEQAVLYDGLNYRRKDFTALDTNTRINKIHATDDFTLYRSTWDA